MREIVVEAPVVNTDLLNNQLRAALGELYFGIRAHDGVVDLMIDEESDPGSIQQAIRLIEVHDAAEVTPEQELRRFIKTMQVDGETDPMTLTELQVKSAALAAILFLRDIL